MGGGKWSRGGRSAGLGLGLHARRDVLGVSRPGGRLQLPTARFYTPDEVEWGKYSELYPALTSGTRRRVSSGLTDRPSAGSVSEVVCAELEPEVCRSKAAEAPNTLLQLGVSGTKM